MDPIKEFERNDYEKEDVCVSASVSSTSVSSRSSDWQHVFQEIRREVDLVKKDDQTMAMAKREAQAGMCSIVSNNITTMWTKVKDTKNLSLIQGTVIVYSSESYLLFFNLVTGKRTVFCPQPVERNNGIGFHVGHPSLDVIAVAEIAVRPRIFLVQYPSLETVDTVSDYSNGRYDSLAFSGDRMLLTLKAGLKLSIAIWDWKTKFRYFNIERESYSQALSLRGSSGACLFSLLCLGKPAKLYLWEMSIFTDIVSLFSKHCSEDKDLDLTDQCLLNGNLYAVDICGDVYKANKESSDHVKFLKIIENDDSEMRVCADSTNTGNVMKGPFIVGTSSSGLAVYGPAQSIKYYQKHASGWICDKVTCLNFPLNHLLSTPNDDFLIGWDKNGLLKIGKIVENLEDKRILPEHITCIAIIHPEDRVVATLMSKKKIQFWTIDQGFYIAEYEFDDNGSGKSMLSHPMVPYLVVCMCDYGDLQIIDVQNVRRPRLFKIIALTFEPLSCIEFNPKGNLIIASGSTLESIFLIAADPIKGFEVHRCAITRYPFSCFATIMGASSGEWIVILLANYRKCNNRYCELLTVPGLTEFIKVDLGQSYYQIMTCYYNPSQLLAVLREDVILTSISIDTKKGKISRIEILEGRHVVPPVSLVQERFHAVSFGGRDGYLILYANANPILTIAPHRFSGILWATFATRTRCFITLARDHSLTCYSLCISCEHDDKGHSLSYMPYKYLPYSKAKMFKRIAKMGAPWDEQEDSQKKIHIYKKGVVRVVGKSLSPQELLRILNTSNKESKLALIKEAAGHFDSDIIIDYIRKWITHYRAIAKKFVTYNEYLEQERPQEMIPWEKIREVEARAYSEYRNHYDSTLSKFMKGVETSIYRWTTAYNRIIETTWSSMEVQSKACKMIFRDFECQSFGLKQDYTNVYSTMERRMSVALMDCLLHPANENFIWDARFEVFSNYWSEYYKYLREGVVETIDEINAAELIQGRDSEEGEDDNYEIQNLSRFLEEDSDLGVSAVFKRRMLEGNLQSYTSMQRLGTLKRTVDGNNLILSRKNELGRLSEIDYFDRERKESDESLFYDSEEELLSRKPVSLKRYKKHKRRLLKKLNNEYPYLDEISLEMFKNIFKIPATFPEECMFLRPAAHLSSIAYSDMDESLEDFGDYTESAEAFLDSSFVKDVPKVDESVQIVSALTLELAADAEEDERPDDKEFDDIEKLLDEPPTEKMRVAKHIVDSDYEAEMLELAKQQALLKKSKKKKEVVALQAESAEEELPDPINKTDENLKKRLRKTEIEKPADRIEISILNEEIMKKEKNMPRNPFAISDLSRLYLILDVDILIESNRKKRKRRKSSIDREAMQVIEHRQAESKNDRMTRLLSMAQDHTLRHFSLLARFQDDEEESVSADSQDAIDMGKARAFIHGGMVENDKEVRRKVIIVGDIVRFKKRRLILGRIKKRTSEEKLLADLDKLGIHGPILPAAYVVGKRQRIYEMLKDKTYGKRESDEETGNNLEESSSTYTMQDLLWLESGLKMFETVKSKKPGPDTTGVVDVKEELVPEPEDLPSQVKTKVSVISALKAFADTDKEPQDEKMEKKERPRLIATANIETVEDGMAYLTAGTVAGNYIQTGPMKSRSQLIAPTTLKLVVDIAHDTKAIYDVFHYYNDQFEALRSMKDTIMRLIQNHQENYAYYINEIRLACREDPMYPEMPPAIYSPREFPEMMINVSDEEVPVSRYYSPSELSLKRRMEEEDELKKRKPKPDPFKLDALQIMMDGVVERRWEDELRKDIPFPKALIGKEPEEWDADEVALHVKFEQDVVFHNSERKRYKQILAEKINQEIEEIRELHLGFDLRVKQMTWKLIEFMQITKELKMFNFRRFRDKAMQMAFLAAADRARTFNEATKASVDQIESLVKVLGSKMKNHRAKMMTIKKIKEQREEKLEDTLKKMGVISADRTFVIANYIRPSFVINPKFIEIQNLLQTVLECFDTFGDPSSHQAQLLSEFFKDVSSSLKRNVPQKLTKQIWESLAQVRKDNIKNDIEIAILQLEYNKAEDAAKFFKGYLKQKQSFTEMISKALENSIQRYKTRQILQEYQVVIPMGMVEIDVGWEQDAKMPNYTDLIIIPGDDYAKLLTERHEAEVNLASQQWRNGVTLNNISKLNSRHYELIARNKLLSLNIRHVERYQPSMHSRCLIKEIKESGLRLGSEKTTKRTGPSVSIEGESRVRREEYKEVLVIEDEVEPPPSGKHFISADAQNDIEEYPDLPDTPYPKAVIEVNPSKLKDKRKSRGRKRVSISKDDIYNEKPFKYLFDDNFMFQDEMGDEDGGSLTSIYSTRSKFSRFSRQSRFSRMSRFSKVSVAHKESVVSTSKSTDRRTSRFREEPEEDDDDDEMSGEQSSDEDSLYRKASLRRTRKTSVISTSVLKRSLSKVRFILKNRFMKKMTLENITMLTDFLKNIDDNMKVLMWRGLKTAPPVQLDNIENFEISDEEINKERSEFQLIKDKYIREAKISIKRNNEIWYPKLSARDAELFKKDTGIDFDKYLEIPKEVEEVYDYDAKPGDVSKSEEPLQAPSQSTEQVSLEYFERKKREFAFTGSWPERLIALWKELEGAEQATKQLEKLIRKSKKPSITDYWNYSDFNFKRHMKNNLVSLLKSYKNQVERYWKDSKAMEREMTRYVEMNKKCVLLFFNYELEQSKSKDGGAQLEEMSKRAASFSTKRTVKVEKAMRKALLLREVQKNQYEILQLQSELELLQLRTYPILMYKHV